MNSRHIGSFFCPVCGELNCDKVSHQKQVSFSPIRAMTCANCMTMNAHDWTYCFHCGYNLTGKGKPEQPAQEKKTVVKYWYFAYDGYYPSGSISDLREVFDTLEDAQQYVTGYKYDYDEIVVVEDSVITGVYEKQRDNSWLYVKLPKEKDQKS